MSAQFQDDDEKKEEKESYSFLKETIKKPPIDKRVATIKILKVAGLGLIFGLMACVSFLRSNHGRVSISAIQRPMSRFQRMNRLKGKTKARRKKSRQRLRC